MSPRGSLQGAKPVVIPVTLPPPVPKGPVYATKEFRVDAIAKKSSASVATYE